MSFWIKDGEILEHDSEPGRKHPLRDNWWLFPCVTVRTIRSWGVIKMELKVSKFQPFPEWAQEYSSCMQRLLTMCATWQASCRRHKTRKNAETSNKYKNNILNIAEETISSASVFFPVMFYLPLSTSETAEFNHGPSLAGASKKLKQIIDFLLS